MLDVTIWYIYFHREESVQGDLDEFGNHVIGSGYGDNFTSLPTIFPTICNASVRAELELQVDERYTILTIEPPFE